MKVVYDILTNLTLIFSLYFVITGLFAFKKNKIIKNSNKKNKFAILIASRNEEKVIGALIDSIKASNYDSKYYDIIVLPNNCTDNTEMVAKEKNVIVKQVNAPTKSKGEVLRFAFSEYKDTDYDAYIILDADNLIHHEFLSKMNDAINSGYEVAQGFRDAKNPSDNWITGSYTIFYYLQNFFFNKARMSLNGSAAINGTGFMIAKSVIDKHGFNTKTLTEDSEFTGICAINNIKIGFVKDAITYDEHPLNFKDSWRQRKRWSSGSINCLTIYFKPLIKDIFTKFKLSSLDMLFFYSTPVIQVLSFILTSSLFIFHIVRGILIHHLYYDLTSICFFLGLYIINVLLNIFIVKLYGKKLKDHFKGIIGFPIFVLTWIPINIASLFNRTKHWEEIKHNRVVNLENLENLEKNTGNKECI